MFSGLKYIFGYGYETNPSASPTSDDSNSRLNDHDAKTSGAEQNSMISSGSSSLEQTLNEATTKFTEQLLPPQASIEQLQSSSQHLLPSIPEQHEEGELRKKKEEKSNPPHVDDDDDGCIEVDSWELLDFVETAENNNNSGRRLDLSAQKNDSPLEVCKASTSGILKSSKTLSTGNVQQRQQISQKPKVSFETPDLVNDKQSKQIEQNDQLGAKATIGGKSKGRNKKRNNQAGTDDTTKEASFSRQKSGISEGAGIKDTCSAKNMSTNDVENKLVPTSNDKCVVKIDLSIDAKPMPVLNYAAAVLKKPMEKKVEKDMVVEAKNDSYSVIPGAQKSNKRNRALSTSSWSSSEEMWPETDKESISKIDESCFVENDDNVSIDSSGLSDGDDGYEAITDHYWKPRRGGSKRWRNSPSVSNSSSLLASMYKRGADKVARPLRGNIKIAAPSKEQNTDYTMIKPFKAPSLRGARNKKKRVDSVVPRSQDFLKLSNQGNQASVADKSTSTMELPLPGSSNDSSDIAEMDESWYVTPPPCFTGANKSSTIGTADSQPKTKEAARENELIEHPSVPLSSKSSRSTAANSTELLKLKQCGLANETKAQKSSKVNMHDLAWEDEEEDEDDIDFSIHDADWIPASQPVKQAAKKATTKGKLSEGKSCTSKAALPSNGKCKDTKISKEIRKGAWKNKFIVDDWNLDDHEDPDNDFDDIFEPVKKKKAVSKSKKVHQKKQKKQKDFEKNESDSVERLSESDVSNDMQAPSEITESDSTMKKEGERIVVMRPNYESFDDNSTSGDFVEKENRNTVKVAIERRPPTQVRPIEPERRPGWLLKRQRSKRRSSSGPTPAQGVSSTKQRANKKPAPVAALKGGHENASNDSSATSTARSTPTLIDRIGSSIVTNISHLTNGLVASGVLYSSPVSSVSSLVESDDLPRNSLNQAVVCRPILQETCNIADRKKMSKGYLKRQNICAKHSNSQRRPDRRLKMFTTPNGCSVNRKVQSNFH